MQRLPPLSSDCFGLVLRQKPGARRDRPDHVDHHPVRVGGDEMALAKDL